MGEGRRIVLTEDDFNDEPGESRTEIVPDAAALPPPAAPAPPPPTVAATPSAAPLPAVAGHPRQPASAGWTVPPPAPAFAPTSRKRGLPVWAIVLVVIAAWLAVGAIVIASSKETRPIYTEDM